MNYLFESPSQTINRLKKNIHDYDPRYETFEEYQEYLNQNNNRHFSISEDLLRGKK